MRIVRDQMKMRLDSSASLVPVHFTAISKDETVIDEIYKYCGENCHLLRHVPEGDENLTLQSLYEYCQNHADAKVTYIHNKGSLHATPKNRKLRNLLTKAVFSDECQSLDSDTCNVCGARFSPFPHIHMAGNMWSAECSYVNRLIPPNFFHDSMEELVDFVINKPGDVPKPTFQQIEDEYFVGLKRYASEHWVGSHPSVQPCDVFPGEYLCGYHDLPDTNIWDPDLQSAPRYDVGIFEKRAAEGNWFCGQARLLEFQFLYNARPPPDSFIWKFYDAPFKKCPTPLTFEQHEHLYQNLTNI